MTQNKSVTAAAARSTLKKFARPASTKGIAQFFKTGKGEYGEGDVFYGVTVPETRSVAKRFQHLPLTECKKLLRSKVHEERLLALLILVSQFERGDDADRAAIYSFYMKNLKWVNNWDLVDSSAHYIVGAHLLDRSRAPLYKLARSKNLWEKRIAIIATFWFIRRNDYSDALKISEILLQDDHDLIHKAVGWMLREIGNRDLATEQKFLRKHYQKMPRTMLRYAIEKFPEATRKSYLKGTVPGTK